MQNIDSDGEASIRQWGGSNGNHTSLLIIDDDEDEGEYYRAILVEYGFPVVHVALTSSLAVGMARFDPPDLIIFDMSLHGPHECAFFRELQSEGVLGSASVLILTDDAGPRMAEHLLSCGADDVLGKPFAEREFVRRVIARVSGESLWVMQDAEAHQKGL